MVRFRSGKNRLLCVLENSEAGLVDWEAYARHGTASWDELLWGHVAQAEVRVFLQPGQMFDGVFDDPKKFVSFELTSPDLDAPVFGYTPRNMLTLQIIASILREHRASAERSRMERHLPFAGISPVRMTLVIGSENDSYGSNQFRIVGVVADSWMKSTWGDLEDTWVAPELDIDETIEDMAERMQRKKKRANRATRNIVVD